MASEPSIYKRPFVLLCLSSLLFSASFNMLIPELPAYLSSLGGAEYKGLLIALFTLTAGIARPFSGKLTDTVGRVPVMMIGAAVCIVCGILYPILSSVAGLLFVRLLHGFSTGFKPTASSAYIADLIPQNRWGEALGMHGLCFSIGMAVGPLVGSMIAQKWGIFGVFYASSIFAALSMIIVIRLKETMNHVQKFEWKLLRISHQDWWDKPVLPAAILTLLYYMAYGVILTLVPDWTTYLGIANKGLFFAIYTVSSLVVRFIAGKWSDRYGRVPVMKWGLICMAISLLVLGGGTEKELFYAGAALYGVATGIVSPALNAFTIDLSNPSNRGKALSTMYIALEAGIGLGAIVSGSLYLDRINWIPGLFAGSAMMSMGALIYLLIWSRRQVKSTVSI
jgi:MFS family permease